MNSPCETSDLLVFSHSRWDNIYQRQQHLLSRYAKFRRVYFIEDAITGITREYRSHVKKIADNISVIVPYLPKDMNEMATSDAMKEILNELIQTEKITNFTTLYYTPKYLNYASHLNPSVILFDCMDDQSYLNENELLNKANLIFTSSQSLYEEKNPYHYNLHLLPNSVDYDHFAQSRLLMSEPEEQINIPHPRIGYHGMIDEKFDVDLLESMADLRPEFHFIIMGTVIGIDPKILPIKSNIHYLGNKDYQTLPQYFSSWDCSFIPYAINDVARFSGPTKIPEFLASGKPVVSTSIFDIIHPYADAKLIYIADHPEHFVECIEKAINESNYDPEWLERVDQFLEGKSWDATFQQMAGLEIDAIKMNKKSINSRYIPAYMDSALISIGIV
jgi:UDP-galactopyranose mutase